MGVWPWSRVELYHEHGLGALVSASGFNAPYPAYTSSPSWVAYTSTICRNMTLMSP